MQSLIKRRVDISLDAHVQHILRLVEDAYILQKEREIETGLFATSFQHDNMLYYRMLRRTGHTAALKKLLSEKTRQDMDAEIFAVFQTQTELRNYRNSSDPSCRRSTTFADWRRGSGIEKANIIIFPDATYGPDRMKIAHTMLLDTDSFPNLRLVVFLG